jgi:hypothetical protein
MKPHKLAQALQCLSVETGSPRASAAAMNTIVQFMAVHLSGNQWSTFMSGSG